MSPYAAQNDNNKSDFVNMEINCAIFCRSSLGPFILQLP